MARLALFAPPSAVSALLPMIYNILVDHAGSHVLIHRTKNMDLGAFSSFFLFSGFFS
jgi:hypothetical protein